MSKHAVIPGKGMLGQGDSPELWREILSHSTVFDACRRAQEILVVAGGHGTEVDILIELHGPSVINKITFNDRFMCFTNAIKRKYPGVEILLGKAEEMAIGKKFDVIVGNPPFRDNDNKAERWSLWIPFVTRCWNELAKADGVVAMITPVSWMAPNSDINKIIVKNAEVINLDAGSHFNVGSTFSYYVLNKSAVPSDIEIINNGKKLSVSRSVPFIPQQVVAEALSINNKTLLNTALPKFAFQRTSQHHTSKKEIFGQGTYRVFHTHAQTLNSTVKMDDHNDYKVMFTLSGYSTALIDKDISCSQAVAWAIIDQNEISAADQYFNGKLVQFLIQANKWSGWNNLEVIKLIPKIDLTTPLNDSAIYKLFKLTKKEIDYIESFVK